jgi:hypothetical protein
MSNASFNEKQYEIEKAEAVAEERAAIIKIIEAMHAGHDSWEWCDCEEMITAIRARGLATPE